MGILKSRRRLHGRHWVRIMLPRQPAVSRVHDINVKETVQITSSKLRSLCLTHVFLLVSYIYLLWFPLLGCVRMRSYSFSSSNANVTGKWYDLFSQTPTARPMLLPAFFSTDIHPEHGICNVCRNVGAPSALSVLSYGSETLSLTPRGRARPTDVWEHGPWWEYLDLIVRYRK
jgi:hypothetical protein